VKRIRRVKKAKLLADMSDDHRGRNYKCGWCGFAGINDQRDLLGGIDAGDAVSHKDYPIASMGIMPGNKNTAISICRTIRNDAVSSKLDSSGDAVRPINYREVGTGGGGCPFCHSLNWKGDFRF